MIVGKKILGYLSHRKVQDINIVKRDNLGLGDLLSITLEGGYALLIAFNEQKEQVEVETSFPNCQPARLFLERSAEDVATSPSIRIAN